MRLILLLSLFAMLVACASPETNEIAFNRYTVQTPYGDDIPYDVAVDRLTRKSEKICDEGFRKVNDYDTSVTGEKLLVWEIVCEGVTRTDVPAIRTRPRGS